MFKKTLLAFAITGAVTGMANAAQIATGHTDANATVTGTAAQNCDLAAVQLGAILQNSGNAEGGNDDALTDNNASGRADVGSAVMTGADACLVTELETVNLTTVKASIEAAQVGAAQLPGVVIAGIGGYEDESTITIDISNAKVDLTKTVAPFLEYSVGSYLAADGVTVVPATGVRTIPVLDITETQVRFTVPVGQDVPPLAVISIEDVFLSATGLTGTTVVDIKSKATNTAGLDYDVTDWTPVLELKPQYSAAVSRKYDAIIDVTEQRQSLLPNTTLSAPDALDEDTFVLDVTQEVTAGIGAELAATGGALSIISQMTGGFGWMDTDGDGTISQAEINQSATLTTTATAGADTLFAGTLDATNTILTYTTSADGSPTAGAQTIDQQYQVVLDTAALHAAGLGNPLSPYANAQMFEATFSAFSTAPVVKEMKACDAATGLVCEHDAGEWVLNGSVLTVPYMPFGDNTQVILRHTNTGDQDGQISIRYMIEELPTRAADTAWVSIPAPLATPSVGGVLDIKNEVMNAIMAHAGVTKGKVAIEITTEAPESDITVYAAYKVLSEEDRGFVGTFGEHGSADQN